MHRLAIAALIALAFAVSGCGDDDKTDDTGVGRSPQPAGARLQVAMKEFKFTPAAAHTRAGKVRIAAKNRGKVDHELVLLRSDADPAKLPVKNGQVDESKSVGAVPEVLPGRTGSKTLDLKPGRYVMICNIPGHYEGGMYGTLTVR